MKDFWKGFRSRISWTSGLLIGLFLASTLVMASVSLPYLFSPGEVISSNEVNENFQELEDAINRTPYGVLLKLSSNQTVTGSSSVVWSLAQLNDLFRDQTGDGSYSTTNNSFTIQAGEAGFYALYFKGSATASGACHQGGLAYTVDAGTNVVISNNIGSTSVAAQTFLYAEEGDVLRFYLGAQTSMNNGCAGGTVTYNGTNLYLAIVKIL